MRLDERMNVTLGLLVCQLLFHDFGYIEWLCYRERYGPTFTDRERPMLVRFPSCGDGPKPAILVAALCFILSSPFQSCAVFLLVHYQRMESVHQVYTILLHSYVANH